MGEIKSIFVSCLGALWDSKPQEGRIWVAQGRGHLGACTQHGAHPHPQDGLAADGARRGWKGVGALCVFGGVNYLEVTLLFF